VEAAWLAAAVTGGMGVYAGASRGLGSEEWAALRALVSRRARRV